MNESKERRYEDLLNFIESQCKASKELIDDFKNASEGTQQLFIDQYKEEANYITFLKKPKAERKQDNKMYYDIMNFINNYLITAMTATREDRERAGITDQTIQNYLAYIKLMREEAEE